MDALGSLSFFFFEGGFFSVILVVILVNILASSYVLAIRVDSDHCDHPGVILAFGRQDVSSFYAYYL